VQEKFKRTSSVAQMGWQSPCSGQNNIGPIRIVLTTKTRRRRVKN